MGDGRRILAVGAATLVAALAGAPAQAAIHPGVQTFTHHAQCTADFVFSDGPSAFIGQAAHCSATGMADELDGCGAASLPLGTEVDIGGSKPGVMVYNSWLAMQAAHEQDDDVCDYNDFALIKIDAADIGQVDPEIPDIGGPTGLSSDGPNPGDTVASYGSSALRAGITQLSPKHGNVFSRRGNGWHYTVFTMTPGIPGDSGSAFIDSNGHAFGVLSTIALAPLPASNGVGDLGRELAYARSHGGPNVHLVTVGSPVVAPPASPPAAAKPAKKHKKHRKPRRARKASKR